MAQRKLVVDGRGEDATVTFTLEARSGKLWLTSFDCPFAIEAILLPAQADTLVELINKTTKEARQYKDNPGS